MVSSNQSKLTYFSTIFLKKANLALFVTLKIKNKYYNNHSKKNVSFQKFCGNIRRNYHKVKGFQFFIRERERDFN